MAPSCGQVGGHGRRRGGHGGRGSQLLRPGRPRWSRRPRRDRQALSSRARPGAPGPRGAISGCQRPISEPSESAVTAGSDGASDDARGRPAAAREAGRPLRRARRTQTRCCALRRRERRQLRGTQRRGDRRAKEERQEGEAEATGCGAGPSQLLQGNMMGCRL